MLNIIMAHSFAFELIGNVNKHLEHDPAFQEDFGDLTEGDGLVDGISTLSPFRIATTSPGPSQWNATSPLSQPPNQGLQCHRNLVL